jgi:hypothetical protein
MKNAGRLSRGGPGGGLGSRVAVRKPVVTGATATGYNPGWVGQLGEMQGTHSTESNKPLTKAVERPAARAPHAANMDLGNIVAPRAKKMGDDRIFYASGTQGTHGQPAAGAERPGRGDILSEFGPERRR